MLSFQRCIDLFLPEDLEDHQLRPEDKYKMDRLPADVAVISSTGMPPPYEYYPGDIGQSDRL